MLSEQLPKCLCGSHDYRGGGGCVGGEISYTSFQCGVCNRPVFVLEGQIEVLITKTQTQGSQEDRKWGKAMTDYINGPLMAAIRTARELKNYHPVLPQLPDELTAYTMAYDRESGWVLVDREESRKTSVPRDPIRVHHDELWSKMLDKMDLKGVVKEIPNRYFDDQNNLEPWYELTMPTGEVIRFGPRKRVFSIQVTSEKPFSCEGIAKAAQRDNVTFTTDGHRHDWKARRVNFIEVHAWGEEKFLSYFGWIMWDLGRTYGSNMKREPAPEPKQSREYTVEEVQKLFLDRVYAQIEYWDEQVDNKRDSLHGLAFSIMVLLDGGAVGMPSFIVAPRPHETDKDYHLKNGESWFPENHKSNVNCDISGTLHDNLKH